MDGCPCQNSKKVSKVLEDVGALVFKIPPPSPDLNLIENIVALVTKALRKQFIKENVVREMYDEFVRRLRDTILNSSILKIDRIIESMDKGITLILES